MTRFQKLVGVATAATFLLVLSGGPVRAGGARADCLGWPLCQGSLAPPAGGALIDYGHRLVALAVSLLVVAVAVAAWRSHRRQRGIIVPALLAAALLAVQVALGGVSAMDGRPPAVVTAHLGTSMALFACLLVVMVSAFAPGSRASLGRFGTSEGFAFLAGSTALAIFALMLTGSYVTGQGAGFACRGWPLCNGAIFPGGDRLTDINAFHRLAAASAGVLVGVLIWQVASRHRQNRWLVAAAATSGALFAGQVIVGAGNVWLHLNEGVRVAHLGMAALVWGALVVTAALAFHAAHAAAAVPAAASGDGGRRSWRRSVIAYVNLTKPRIIELLLVTTVPTMVLAAKGMPNPLLIAGTLIGGMLTSGGANAINCYVDRDIDEVMRRTKGRSLPSHRVTPERALLFGVAIGVLGFLELAAAINLLSAVLAVSAILFYVFVYTLWLKRSTVQNIVIGGAAGAVPPLVGWAAVTGRIDLPALVLFAIVFFWTPPHFWALALRFRSDYAAANVPMLPVVRGDDETRRQIAIYSVALVAITLLLYVTGGAGVVYLAVAIILGAGLVRMSVQLLRQKDAYPVMKLFSYSITYLAALFAAMIVDQAVRSLL